MIASYSSNFIFLKTRKTAGTSAEMVLGAWCSDGDICSPFNPEDEVLRQRFGSHSRNFTADKSQELELTRSVAAGDMVAVKALLSRCKPTFYNHMPAKVVRAALPDLWPDAFKFAVERHPYEKVISQTWWDMWWNVHGMHSWRTIAKRFLVGREHDFSSTLATIIDAGGYVNYPIYTIDGSLAVDEVILYEHLWERLSQLAARFGKDMPDTLPRAKGMQRRDRRPAAEILSDQQKEKIYKTARVEFDLFGFKP